MIQKSLLLSIETLKDLNLTYSFDSDSYISDLQESVPFKIGKQEYFLFVRALLPSQVIDDDIEYKFFHNVSNRYPKDSILILMEMLMRKPWTRANNMLRYLGHLLNTYDSQYRPKGHIRQSLISTHLAISMEDKTHTINEMMLEMRFNNVDPFRIGWKEMLDYVEDKYPCPEFQKLFVKYKNDSSGTKTIEIPMTTVKFLEVTNTICNEPANRYALQKGTIIKSKSSYAKFLEGCTEYIESLKNKNIPITGIRKLKTFYDKMDSSELFPSELQFIFALVNVTDEDKGIIASNIEYFLAKYDEVVIKLQNCS